MECLEAKALKSSFLSEIAMISTQQVCFDDVRCLASVTCDDFSVDDLFDFSDKHFEDGCLQESEEDEAKDSFSLSSQQRSFNSDTLCNNENEFGPLPEGELDVPVDDLENLEWLSQIVDDSRTEISLLSPVGSFKEKTGSFLENRCEPVAVQRIREPCFPLPAFRKSRGKRSRPNGRVVWTLRSPSLTPDMSSNSYSSNGSSTISPFMFADPVKEAELFSSVEKPPPAKKQKKKPAGETGSGSGVLQTLRRCTHCQVQKTPQWRTGPLGPKTLCNACGVRYKTGRLFPEYRPACSPTFSQEIHSNSHRKVLEMRLKKETGGPLETGLTPMVPSC